MTIEERCAAATVAVSESRIVKPVMDQLIRESLPAVIARALIDLRH